MSFLQTLRDGITYYQYEDSKTDLSALFNPIIHSMIYGIALLCLLLFVYAIKLIYTKSRYTSHAIAVLLIMPLIPVAYLYASGSRLQKINKMQLEYATEQKQSLISTKDTAIRLNRKFYVLFDGKADQDKVYERYLEGNSDLITQYIIAGKSITIEQAFTSKLPTVDVRLCQNDKIKANCGLNQSTTLGNAACYYLNDKLTKCSVYKDSYTITISTKTMVQAEIGELFNELNNVALTDIILKTKLPTNTIGKGSSVEDFVY